MFEGAFVFNQPLDFDTSSVSTMSYMFDSSGFNQPLALDTASVTTMRDMFSGVADGVQSDALVFNQLLTFDTGRVEEMWDSHAREI